MNQIDEVCETIEKSINQAVQKTLDQLEKDCDLITSSISSKLEQDRFVPLSASTPLRLSFIFVLFFFFYWSI